MVIDDQAPARQPLAGVIVGIADQIERNASGQECAEALPGGAVELNVDRVFRQPGVPVTARNLARQHRADRAIDVANRHDEADSLAAFERRPALLDQLVVERLAQSVILRFNTQTRHIRRHLRLIKNAAEVETARLPMIDAAAHI